MLVLLAAALAWCLMSLTFLRSRWGARIGNSRPVEFAPSGDMSPELLFGCLLSANFAVLMQDNFNQLASALPERQVRKLLAGHWGIEAHADCVQVIEQRMARLGEMSRAEIQAVAAWLDEQRSEVENAHASRPPVEHLASTDDLSHGHLSVLAWDIQQLAYLVRLACAVGHVSQAHAEAVLARLALRARLHYGSWNVYSMAALVGLGVRGAMEVFETSAWERYSRTHSIFLSGRHSPTRFASSWSAARVAVPRLPAGNPRPAPIAAV
ncbi:DUF1266 domain-containing protein [Variovorax sp. YR216]|uniref:DUF1266 domain-containing protein n=1 Tax=Variovorax sp. YR216 TaxID=1882828 RepID=UPI00089A3645|nr:DUF1266 domain-containing protein [Variovorax sp. YR216]SEB26247.1 Protein of unknown function [Variovorax sp. YR216]